MEFIVPQIFSSTCTLGTIIRIFLSFGRGTSNNLKHLDLSCASESTLKDYNSVKKNNIVFNAYPTRFKPWETKVMLVPKKYQKTL